MKIRMKVEGSGPDGMVQPGEEIDVGEANGVELIEAGLAELVEEDEPAPQEEPNVLEEEEPAEAEPDHAEEWPETEGDASGMDEWPEVEGDAVDLQE